MPAPPSQTSSLQDQKCLLLAHWPIPGILWQPPKGTIYELARLRAFASVLRPTEGRDAALPKPGCGVEEAVSLSEGQT